MKTIDNKEENRYFADLFPGESNQGGYGVHPSYRLSAGSEVRMTTERKAPRRKISAKEREFDELLRRAHIFEKNRAAASLHVVRRKRVKAA